MRDGGSMSRLRAFVGLVSLASIAGCAEEITGPTPAPSAIEPQLVCVEQLTTEVKLTGDRFSPLPIETLKDRTLLELPDIELERTVDIGREPVSGPTYLIPDDPTDPDASHVTWTSDKEMSFEVYPELDVEPGLYAINVTNRNGRAGRFPEALLAVPRPMLTRIEPDLLCGDKENVFVLTGDFFLRLPDGQPTITVDGDEDKTYEPMEMSDCRELPGRSGAEACRTVRVRIPDGDLAPGNYDVTLTNPEPANCVSSDAQVLTIVPKPTVTEIVPPLACVAQGMVSVVVRGTGFLSVDGTTPMLTIGTQVYDTTLTETTCDDVDVMREEVQSCTELTAVIAEDDFTAGVYDVVVTNPTPADCPSEEDVSFVVVPEPSVTSVMPDVVCADPDAPDSMLRIAGSGFLFYRDQVPVVRIGTIDFQATKDDASCAPVSGVDDAEACTAMTVSVPSTSLMVGTYDLVVTNPAPAMCASTEPIQVTFVPDPTITSWAPTRLCSGGGSLTIDGTGFGPRAAVRLNDMQATSVDVISSTRLVATFPILDVGGPYDLAVFNAPGCEDVRPAALSVIPGPQIFFADPPVLYSGISTQVLLYVTGVTDMVDGIQLVPAGGGDPIEVTHSFSPARPNRVQITVPSGLDAGSYDIQLQDRSECDAFLADGVAVTDTLTVDVGAIDPPFGHGASDTAVTITGAAMRPMGEVGFMPVPRMYLNPSMPTAMTIATPLEAVTLLGDSRATAVVPSGLAVGTYDLIIVNPDGSVGVLSDAFEVTTDPAPTIDTISPGSVANSSSESFSILGANFRMPMVGLRCNAAGAMISVPAMVTGSTANGIDATFDASTISSGVCVVRVTNDDGTYVDFSALVVTNPAQNIGMPVASTDLGTARRALAAVSGSATRAARFVYAIGGDSGMISGAFDTLEAVPVDIFGVPGDFFELPNRMTAPRTFAGAARIGRFIYVIGGNDSTGVLASIERAVILSPDERPEIVDLGLDVADTGVPPGLYYYRVSAVLDGTDPFNPGGETLASEAFPVIIPDLMAREVQVDLAWSTVPHAASYRIYRTAAGGAAGTEQLIEEILSAATTTFTDEGETPETPTAVPLPFGSTGAFSRVGMLTTARQGAGVAAVLAPGSTTLHHVYVAGGRSDSANLDSIEIVPITVAADGSQTVGTVRAGPTLGAARWQTLAYGATNDIDARISSTQPFLYVAGGTTAAAGGSATGDVDAYPIDMMGNLGTRVPVDNQTPARAGFGAASANNFLYAFGGGGGTASNSIASAEICGAGRPCTAGGMDPPDPPDLVNWNAAGVSLVTARVNMATAVLPGFIYILGGYDGVAATATTEWTNW